MTREVEYWCTHRDADHLLIVLTDPIDDHSDVTARVTWEKSKGDFDWERTTALPPCLRGKFRNEPRCVELGWARSRSNLSLRDPAFQEMVADLAAPLWGRPKDQLIGEDVQQHKRTLLWVRGAVAALVALSLVASVAAVVAVRQRNTAQAKTAIAEARQYAAQAQSAADPYAAVTLAVAAEQRTASPLPEARAAFAAAGQRANTWTSRLVARLTGESVRGDALTWSGDATQVLAATGDGSVQRWNVHNEQSVPGLAGIPQSSNIPGITSFTWAADQTTLVITTEANSFLIRDIQSPEMLAGPFPAGDWEHGGLLMDAALSPDERTVVTGTNEGILRRWDARTGRPVGAELHGPGGFSHVAWSPDGGRLASVADRGLQIWNVSTGMPLRPTPADGAMWSLAWSPDGSRLAVGGEDGVVRLWDGHTGEAVGVPLFGHAGRVTALAWSPDGSRLASAGADVRVWDAATGKAFGVPLSLDGESVALAVAWSPDSRLLASGFTSTSRLISKSSGLVQVWEVAKPPSADNVLRGPAGAVLSTAWSPDSRSVASGNDDGTVWVWDPRTGRQAAGSQLQPGFSGAMVTFVAWSPDGSRLASASGDGIRVWAVVAGKAAPAPWWASGATLTVAWSPDGARLAGGDDQGVVRIWDVAAGKPMSPALKHGIVQHETSQVRWVAWSPDGSRLASGSDDGRVQRWNAATGKPLGAPLRASPQAVRTMVWSPNGDLLATGGQDGAVHLWRADSGQPVRTMRGSDDVVGALAWSPDGTRLASGGSSGTVQVWDAGSGSMLGKTAAVQLPGVASLTWSPDGSELASGGLDKTVRVWRSLTERQACQEAQPELELTKLTRLSAAAGLDVCSHLESVQDLPPIPVLPAIKR